MQSSFSAKTILNILNSFFLDRKHYELNFQQQMNWYLKLTERKAIMFFVFFKK